MEDTDLQSSTINSSNSNALNGTCIDQFDYKEEKPKQSMFKSLSVYLAMIPISVGMYAVYHFCGDFQIWAQLKESVKSTYREYSHFVPEESIIRKQMDLIYSLHSGCHFYCVYHVHLNKSATSFWRE